MLTNVVTGVPVPASVSVGSSRAAASLTDPALVEAPVGALSWPRPPVGLAGSASGWFG